MDKLFILIVVVLCILLINYIYVTREGFQGKGGSSSCNYKPFIEENCESFLCSRSRWL